MPKPLVSEALPEAGSEAPPTFREVWPQLRDLRPSQSALEAQVLAQGIEPGLAIIEEQMGAGKTEMAVYLAEHWNAGRGGSGVYIGLPTQATGNQMHTRYGKYLGDRYPNDPSRKARLVHGMAWLIDEETTEQAPQLAGDPAHSQEEANQAREWFRPLRRALLARDGVGTVDQAMMAALHVKFGSLRLLGLRSKVLVIDEAHAYDAFMSEILGRLLAWCRALQIPVVLLSATLSRAQKAHLVSCYGGDADAIKPDAPYPLMTFVSSGGEVRTLGVDVSREPVRTLELKPHVGALDDATAIARLALSRIQEGGCGCVLMNTVKGAQGVYRAARQLIQSGEFAPLVEQGELILFHARFPAGARAEIEERVTKHLGRGATRENGQRPQRALVIATQVIEQSLDIDFDVMLSQIAPIDLLLQRSGRLWRHREHDAGRPDSIPAPLLEILLPPEPEPGDAPDFGVSEKVYARVILLRTQAVLPQSDVIELPRDFRPLIETVYGDEMPQSELVSPAQFEQAAQQHGLKQREATGKAIEHLLPQPNPKKFDLSNRARAESPESEGANYLRASTRLGDDSRPVLLLHDAKHIRLAQNAASTKPRRRDLKAMFLQKTNVPAWWLKNLEAAAGHSAAFAGEGWLKHHVVIPLRDDEWRSQSGALIRDDKYLGVLYEAPGAEVKAQSQVEADAGFTS